MIEILRIEDGSKVSLEVKGGRARFLMVSKGASAVLDCSSGAVSASVHRYVELRPGFAFTATEVIEATERNWNAVQV